MTVQAVLTPTRSYYERSYAGKDYKKEDINLIFIFNNVENFAEKDIDLIFVGYQLYQVFKPLPNNPFIMK